MKWWPARWRANKEAHAAPAALQVLRGPTHVVSDAVNAMNYEAGHPEMELARLVEAIKQVDHYLDSLGMAEPEYAEVFRTQNAILHDPTWLRKTTAAITKGASAPAAVASAFDSISTMFDSIPNATLKERGTDVRSMSRLVRLALIGAPLERRVPSEPSVWIVDELDAATALQLRPEICIGVAATSDLISGHGIEIATARGFTCVTGRGDAAGVDDGVTVEFS